MSKFVQSKQCDCGGAFTPKTLQKHLQTKIHQKYAAECDLQTENARLKEQLAELIAKNVLRNKNKRNRQKANACGAIAPAEPLEIATKLQQNNEPIYKPVSYSDDNSISSTESRGFGGGFAPSLNVVFTRSFRLNYYEDANTIQNALESLSKNNDNFLNESKQYDYKITVFKGLHLDSAGARNKYHFTAYFGDSRNQSCNYHFYLDDVQNQVSLITKIQSCFL